MKTSNFIVDPERRFCLSFLLFSLPFLSVLRTSHRTHAATSLDARRLLKSGLENIVRDRPAAEEIGRVYLVAHPDEDDLDRLAGGLIDASRDGDSEILKRTIASLRVRDFGNEDITIIDGWVLARVEARICALIHIL